MSNTEQTDGFEQDTNPKGKGPLNVLTILTFIGCAVQLIMTFAVKALMSFAVKAADNPEVWEKMSNTQKDQITKAKEAYILYSQYQIPLIVISLIGITLCFWGALQMRQLKKQGFYAYAVGEFLPIIGSIALMGFGVQYNSITSIIIGLGVPILFTILYAAQLKRMK